MACSHAARVVTDRLAKRLTTTYQLKRWSGSGINLGVHSSFFHESATQLGVSEFQAKCEHSAPLSEALGTDIKKNVKILDRFWRSKDETSIAFTLKQMQKSGIYKDVEALRLLYIFFRDKDLNQAQWFVEQICEFSIAKPPSRLKDIQYSCYHNLLFAYYCEGRLSDAIKLFHDKKYFHLRSRKTYRLILKIFLENDMKDELKLLLQNVDTKFNFAEELLNGIRGSQLFATNKDILAYIIQSIERKDEFNRRLFDHAIHSYYKGKSPMFAMEIKKKFEDKKLGIESNHCFLETLTKETLTQQHQESKMDIQECSFMPNDLNHLNHSNDSKKENVTFVPPITNRQSFNSVLSRFIRSGHFDEARELHKLYPQFHSKSSYSKLISNASYALSLDDTLDIAKKKKDSYGSLEERDLNRLYHCALHSNPLIAVEILEELIGNGFHQNRVLFCCKLISVFARTKNHCGILSVFDLTNQHKIKLPPPIYTDSIKQLSSLGFPQDALRIHQIMKTQQIPRSRSTFGTLIKTCYVHSVIEGLQEILNDIEESQWDMDVLAYNDLIFLYVKVGDHSKAISTFHEMQQNQVTPTVETLNGLVMAMKHSSLDAVRMILLEFKNMNIFPNLQVYNSLLSAYGMYKDVDGALGVLEKMKSAGYKMDLKIYGCLINIFVISNYVDQVYDIYHQMEFEGIQPDALLFNTLLKVFSQEGKVKYFFKILGRMEKEKYNIDIELCYNLINTLIDQGRIGIALDAYNELECRAFTLHISYYVELLRRCENLSEAQKALRIFHGMYHEHKVDRKVGTLLIETFQRCGDSKTVDNLRKLFL